MHSYLICANTDIKISEEIRKLLLGWNIAEIDQVVVKKTGLSIGISEVRSFISTLSLKPQLSKYVCGIIYNANFLTIEAQQALLKTLEEPPPNAKIILCAENQTQLLQTIVSRCECINVKSDSKSNDPTINNPIISFLNEYDRPASGDIAKLEVLSMTKDELLTYINESLIYYYIRIMENSEKNRQQYLKNIQNLLKCKQLANSNVNSKLITDSLVI